MFPSTGRANLSKWIALFGLWVLHGVLALRQFVTLPSDPHPFLFGSSPQRLLMSLVLLSWILFNLGLMATASRTVPRIEKWLTRNYVWDSVLALAALIISLRLGLAFVTNLWAGQLASQYGAYVDRLLPLVNLLTFVSVEISILAVARNFLAREGIDFPLRSFLVRTFVVLSTLGFLAAVVSFSGLGIAPLYRGDWSRGLPAVPLLEWQIILACLFCLAVMVIESRQNTKVKSHYDLWICLFIWLGAVFIWLSQPVVPNASALRPHEPNFEVYPFIDSQVYDGYAQSILIGNGLGNGKIPQRPLYIVFLAFLHLLAGQDYQNVIIVQSLVWAVFPVLLYLFGRDFFGRPIGVSMALLAILRDYTSNLVSPFTGNISYSKLYLSEIPTAIFLILFLFIGVRWVRAGYPLFLGFLMGGILGTGMLIRTQVIVALPVIFLFALLVDRKRIGPLVRSSFLMVLTIALVVSPWLWRNWRITGELIFDDPGSQTANLAMRYSRLNGVEVDIMPLPGESSTGYNDRLMSIAREAIAANPGGVVWAISSSFLNHVVNNILLFPLRNEIRDFGELWTPSDAFWEKWEGTPTSFQGWSLVFYGFLFGLGVAVAWHKNGWLGLLPLTVNLLYNLWTSIALLSGQRFMLTMDWSVYLYYMIGLFALLSGLLLNLKIGRRVIVKWCQSNNVASTRELNVDKPWRQYLIASLLFFGAGVSLPLSEKVFSERYPQVSLQRILDEIEASLSYEQTGLDEACFHKIFTENQFGIIQGRALYPRYYEPGDGETFTDAAGYKITDQARLVFEMVGQADHRVVVPISQQPEFFPNASDVTLIYGGDGDVWFILVKHKDKEQFYVSDLFDKPFCGE